MTDPSPMPPVPGPPRPVPGAQRSADRPPTEPAGALPEGSPPENGTPEDPEAGPFAGLDQLPVADHVAVFDAEHSRLQRELSSIDQL
jgi:hypothetical protein